MTIRTGLYQVSLAIVCLGCASTIWGESRLSSSGGSDIPAPAPAIVIIIDDLGHARVNGQRVAALPAPVACAILPHTPFAANIASHAHRAGKEVMLHLPLEPAYRDSFAVGAIDIDTTQAQLERILAADLASVPHVVGVNNHMGSLLTQHPGHMQWLMQELNDHGELFFVDSYTSESSVALLMAQEAGIPSTRRDVFLDNTPTEAAIDREFQRLKKLARQNGIAIGIGHPYPATIDYLEKVLPRLKAEGIRVISVADSIRYRSSVRTASVSAK